jgi:ATP/maltotriose-dependent transcriptional regulator MalT
LAVVLFENDAERVDEVGDHLRKAIRLAERSGNQLVIGKAHADHAAHALMLAAHHEARPAIRQALEAARKVGSQTLSSTLLWIAGFIELDAGQADKAADIFFEGLAEVQRTPARSSKANLEKALALCAEMRGELEEAEEHLRRGLEFLSSVTNNRSLGQHLVGLARVRALQGDQAEAEASLAKAEEVAKVAAHPALSAMVEISRAQLLICQAESKELADDTDARAKLLQKAEQIIERNRRAAAHDDDVRIPHRLVEKRLRAVTSSARTIELMRDGSSITLPSGEVVDLKRRRVSRRLIFALAEARAGSPGRLLSAHELIDMGWPDENVPKKSATNRLYVALTSLRQLGLEGILIQDVGGWQIDPAVEVVWRGDA